MSFTAPNNKFTALNNWFLTDLGTHVAQCFQQEIASLKDKLHGEISVQIGACGGWNFLDPLSFQNKWIIAHESHSQVAIISSLDTLPLRGKSVDSFILPLITEAFSFENNPLDEIDRILKPGGYIIFLGINPWSFWGWQLRFSNHNCFGRKKKARSFFALKRIMLRKGYEQLFLSNFYFVPPIQSSKVIRSLEVFNLIGKMIAPWPAGFYCFVMQKCQKTVTPLPSLSWEDIFCDKPLSLPCTYSQFSSAYGKMNVFKRNSMLL